MKIYNQSLFRVFFKNKKVSFCNTIRKVYSTNDFDIVPLPTEINELNSSSHYLLRQFSDTLDDYKLVYSCKSLKIASPTTFLSLTAATLLSVVFWATDTLAYSGVSSLIFVPFLLFSFKAFANQAMSISKLLIHRNGKEVQFCFHNSSQVHKMFIRNIKLKRVDVVQMKNYDNITFVIEVLNNLPVLLEIEQKKSNIDSQILHQSRIHFDSFIINEVIHGRELMTENDPTTDEIEESLIR